MKSLLKENTTKNTSQVVDNDDTSIKSNDVEKKVPVEKGESSAKILSKDTDVITKKNRDSVTNILTALPKASTSKMWVEPVYEIKHHPAKIRKKREIARLVCQPSTCGREFSSEKAWQEHRPKI
ncbi:MAG: hypothetical protein PUI85_03000 [Eubacteriales bacterium]|nr:hypothetical protein [Eubacteriales bacterium]MDY3333167.1 hypothetical protein [Gallibacter sp.]